MQGNLGTGQIYLQIHASLRPEHLLDLLFQINNFACKVKVFHENLKPYKLYFWAGNMGLAKIEHGVNINKNIGE